MTTVLSDYLSVRLGGQLFGIPVGVIEEVVGLQNVTPVPRAPAAVAGMMNLRGRPVTVLRLGSVMRLRAVPSDAAAGGAHVVICVGQDLYSLLVEEVCEVLSLPPEKAAGTIGVEPLPANLSASLRAVARGLYRLPARTLIILDIDMLLKKIHSSDDDAAAGGAGT